MLRNGIVVDLAKAKLHSVFPVERHGDTLLVLPRGDAPGFGAKELQSELNTILEWLGDPGLKNVVIDLSTSNYYGSQIIGAVNSMILKVRDSGGQSGVCGASDDMREGINVMNLDRLWTFYDSRNAALAELAIESKGEKAAAAMRTRPMRIAVGVGVVVVLVVAVVLVNYLNRPSGAAISAKAYDTFAEIEKELSDKRSESLSNARWNLFSNQSGEKVRRQVELLEAAGDIDEPLQSALLKAGRDCLLPMLKQPKEPSADLSEKFRKHMEEAKRLLAEGKK